MSANYLLKYFKPYKFLCKTNYKSFGRSSKINKSFFRGTSLFSVKYKDTKNNTMIYNIHPAMNPKDNKYNPINEPGLYLLDVLRGVPVNETYYDEYGGVPRSATDRIPDWASHRIPPASPYELRIKHLHGDKYLITSSPNVPTHFMLSIRDMFSDNNIQTCLHNETEMDPFPFPSLGPIADPFGLIKNRSGEISDDLSIGGIERDEEVMEFRYRVLKQFDNLLVDGDKINKNKINKNKQINRQINNVINNAYNIYNRPFGFTVDDRQFDTPDARFLLPINIISNNLSDHGDNDETADRTYVGGNKAHNFINIFGKKPPYSVWKNRF